MMDTKHEILCAALDCFSVKGYSATSIKDIAAAAKIKSPALIYHYFENKEDLFRSCALYFNHGMAGYFNISLIECTNCKMFISAFLHGYSAWLDNPITLKLWNSALSVINTNPSILRHFLQASRASTLQVLNSYIFAYYPSLIDDLSPSEIFGFLQMITSPLMVSVTINRQAAISDDQSGHEFLIENISEAYCDWFDKQVERIAKEKQQQS